MRFKLALDCRVKAQEYSLSKRHNEQLMQLQQHSQARRAQLEQQACDLGGFSRGNRAAGCERTAIATQSAHFAMPS